MTTSNALFVRALPISEIVYLYSLYMVRQDDKQNSFPRVPVVFNLLLDDRVRVIGIE